MLGKKGEDVIPHTEPHLASCRKQLQTMNNSGVMPQEKMELDLEIPSSLVQSDGHLRRSNSAPMINGLRFSTTVHHPYIFAVDLPSFHCEALFLVRVLDQTHEFDLRFVCDYHCSDSSQVFQREVLRCRRNSTTVVNRPNMVGCASPERCTHATGVLSDSVAECVLPSATGSLLTHPGAQHQTSSDQTSKDVNSETCNCL